MRVLALDTATEVCGVAVMVDGKLLAETAVNQGLTHTRLLLPAIDAVLDQSALQFDELDALVVSRGPGSFTGLRIGIGTAKGLALATGIPLVAISSLAVLAHQAPESVEWVCPMIDARRREVYWSVYHRQGGGLQPVTQECAGPVQKALDTVKTKCLFIGSGARLYADTIEKQASYPSCVAERSYHDLKPGVLAKLGAEQLALNGQVDPHHFTPVYLRKSDAELGKPQSCIKKDGEWT